MRRGTTKATSNRAFTPPSHGPTPVITRSSRCRRGENHRGVARNRRSHSANPSLRARWSRGAESRRTWRSLPERLLPRFARRGPGRSCRRSPGRRPFPRILPGNGTGGKAGRSSGDDADRCRCRGALPALSDGSNLGATPPAFGLRWFHTQTMNVQTTGSEARMATSIPSLAFSLDTASVSRAIQARQIAVDAVQGLSTGRARWRPL